jgi:photosystem II stability/assembly factor-like uncharacterized protein
MIDAHHGWAIGTKDGHGVVLRTTDGGGTWADVTPAQVALGPESCPGCPGRSSADFLNADVAWVALSHPDGSKNEWIMTVFKTTNGGATWTGSTVRSVFNNGDDLFAPYLGFINANDGWLMVHPDHGMNSNPGELMSTSDGGASWREVTQTGSGLPFGGTIRFLTNSTGWLVGTGISTTNNEMYMTTDGGKSWTRQDLPFAGATSGSLSVDAPPSFFNATTGIVTGTYVPNSHLAVDFAKDVFETSDGGRNWHAVASVRAGVTVSFIDSKRGWLWTQQPRDTGSTAPVRGSLLVTANGGQTWTPLPLGSALSGHLQAGEGVTSIDFVSASDGWMLVQPPSALGAQLLRTTDGAHSWTDLPRLR